MKKIITVILAAMTIVLLTAPAVSAAGYTDIPYKTYAYWQKGSTREANEIRQLYVPKSKITGFALGTQGFSMPTDVDCDGEGNIYILDGDNGRIVVVNPNLTLNRIITASSSDGGDYSFAGASGIYIKSDNTIYIADTTHKRVLVLAGDGALIREILLPDSPVIPDGFNYAPIKVVTDSRDYVYVLSSGSYYGALVYSNYGDFLGFYGANTVAASALDAFGTLWNRLTQTEVKRAASVQKLPYQFISMDIDDKDFIYSLTGLTDSIWTAGTGQIRRLNPAGKNIMKDGDGKSSDSINFTDEGTLTGDSGHPTLTSFTKLCVDTDGFIYALDSTLGHIFIYDNQCNSIAVFGGIGDQTGTFARPESVAVYGDRLYVLDSLDSSLTVFELTDYGRLYKQAQMFTLNGKYQDSKPVWEQVLKLDKNNQLAYKGLAKAALMENDYDSAISYARLGADQTDYAVAFIQKRSDFLSENMWWIILSAVLLISAAVFAAIWLRRHKKIAAGGQLSFAMGTVIHPFEQFYKVKYQHGGSVAAAAVLLALYYLARVLCDIKSGFSFSIFDAATYNSLETLLGSVGIAVLWICVNWAVCVLAQGKGKIREIILVTCYALIPEIIGLLAKLILTNILVPEESAIIAIITVCCHLVTAVILCIGTMTVHEYDFFKFLSTTVLTLLGMCLIVFIIFMVCILFQELFSFLGSLFTEIFYR